MSARRSEQIRPPPQIRPQSMGSFYSANPKNARENGLRHSPSLSIDFIREHRSPRRSRVLRMLHHNVGLHRRFARQAIHEDAGLVVERGKHHLIALGRAP
jgi:hypothetical protein